MSNDAKIFFMVMATIAMFLALACGFFTIINFFATATAICFALVLYFLFIMTGFATLAGQGNPFTGFKWFTGDGAQRQGYHN